MAKSDDKTTEKKEPSLLAKLVDEWKKAGSKVPAKNVCKQLVADLEKARANQDAAEKALAAAKAKASEAAMACVRAFGPTNVPLGPSGAPHTPMCRGENVYYRALGSADTLQL